MTCFLIISVRINSSCWEMCLIPLFFINFWCSQRILLMGESIQSPHFLSTPHSIYSNGFRVFSNTSAIAKAQTSSLEGRWDFSPPVQHCYVYVPMGNEYIFLQWNDSGYNEPTSKRGLAAAKVWLKVLVQKLTTVFRGPEWALVMFVCQMTI